MLKTECTLKSKILEMIRYDSKSEDLESLLTVFSGEIALGS